MIQKRRLPWLALLVMLSAVRLHAQISGCDDSPEAPSWILAALGSLGMFYGSSWLLTRLRKGTHA